MAPRTGTRHLRISKDNKWDNRQEWKIKDINIGNKQHKVDENGSIINREGIGVPIINIYEFQPNSYRNMEQYIKQVKRQFKRTLEHIADKVSIGGGNLSTILDYLIDVDLKNVTSTTDKIANQFAVDYDNYRRDVFEAPIKDNKSVFNGKYIRSYEMPYNSDIYINVDGISGWDTLGASDIGFAGSKKLQNIFKAITSIIDSPFVPTWNTTKGYKSFYNFTTKFHLINDNFKNLVSNFTYISQLLQGCMWMQYDTFRVPPNVFSVEIPGVIFLQYATAVVNINTVGNKRIINANDIIKSEFGKTGYKLYTDGYGDMFFPDAWEVEVTFKSLIPNSFNTFMNYFENGMGAEGDYRDVINVGSFTINGKDGIDNINTNEELAKAQRVKDAK